MKIKERIIMENQNNTNEVINLGIDQVNSKIEAELKVEILKSLIFLDNDRNIDIISRNIELKELLLEINSKVK